MEFGWKFASFILDSIKPDSETKNFQRLQAGELFAVLLRKGANTDSDKFSDLISKNLEGLTDCIVETITAADTWKLKKVKKTNQICGLWGKAAKNCND